MDINTYIESEIIEQYVLGSVTPQEQQEVECMSKIYPEIKERLTEYQKSIEKMALQMAVEVPEGVRQSIFDEIRKTSQNSMSDEAKSETKIVALNPLKKGSSTIISLLAAACLIGFIITATLYFIKSNEHATLQNTVAVQQSKLDETQASIVELSELASLNQEQLAFIKDVKTNRITLGATANNEGSEAMIFWNKENQRVVLDMTSLPELPADKQYQLWAIIDGVPQDMGMVDMSSETKLATMKPTDKAQAFAITIEPKGGSKVPTLEAMVVVGTVS